VQGRQLRHPGQQLGRLFRVFPPEGVGDKPKKLTLIQAVVKMQGTGRPCPGRRCTCRPSDRFHASKACRSGLSCSVAGPWRPRIAACFCSTPNDELQRDDTADSLTSFQTRGEDRFQDCSKGARCRVSLKRGGKMGHLIPPCEKQKCEIRGDDFQSPAGRALLCLSTRAPDFLCQSRLPLPAALMLQRK
jgi:hypothetical protein